MQSNKSVRVGPWTTATAVAVVVLAIAEIVVLVGNVEFQFSNLLTLLALILALLIALVILLAGQLGGPGTPPGEGESAEKRFPDKGVTVTVPWQGRTVDVVRLPLLPLEKLTSDTDEFKPKRLVMNFEVVDAKDTDTVVTDFEPPFELRVDIPEEYLAGIKHNYDAIEMGFWDGCRWIKFTREKHQFQMRPNDPPGTGAVAIAMISNWADPPCGYGP